MQLSEEYKEIARVWRDQAQMLLALTNALFPPDYRPLPTQGNYRHACPKRGNRSTALQLKEIYLTNEDLSSDLRTALEKSGISVDTVLGQWAFIYREGTCAKKCGRTARSPSGRFVLVAQRPPIEGRVGRA